MRTYLTGFLVVFHVLVFCFWITQEHDGSEDLTVISNNKVADKLAGINSTYREYFSELYPLLVDYSWTNDSDMIRKTAVLLIKESIDNDVDPVLSFGVLLVENPWLDPSAVSYAGAVGHMQIMPNYWADRFNECDSYKTVNGNICIGIRVLKYYLDDSSTEREALLRYNGCASLGSHCINYPDLVSSYMEHSQLSYGIE